MLTGKCIFFMIFVAPSGTLNFFPKFLKELHDYHCSLCVFPVFLGKTLLRYCSLSLERRGLTLEQVCKLGPQKSLLPKNFPLLSRNIFLPIESYLIENFYEVKAF